MSGVTSTFFALLACVAHGLRPTTTTPVVERRAVLDGAAAQLAALAVTGTGTTASMTPVAATAATTTPGQQGRAVNLGKLGIGAWAWGDSLFWGYDAAKDGELKETFEFVAASKAGFIDTAEVYGFGRSETLIGEFARQVPGGLKTPVATKFAALPWRLNAADVVKACEASLKRLDMDSVDLYQVHFPNAWSNAAYWDGLAECVEKGLVKAVGVSNYGVDATKAVASFLAEKGVPLASNQIQYSLLYRYPEQNGLLDTCRALGVDVLAYSPLGLGLLTNKFRRDNDKRPDGPRAAIVETYLADDRFLRLQAALDDVAVKRDATPAAVALNWCRAKGTIPIAGARTLNQAKQNINSLDWDLSPAELQALDDAAAPLPWLGIKPPFADKDVFTGLKMFDS